ncbi:Hypothetical protein, putative [Bodo saltans]|uniref:Uncharacterized protein n=1 Tax=Bodo saltans TaxID=75058 RepID=A0A0S4JQQ3_BODSA|nr:Hypothetical protein, putative [Bodo saltans]|eukprot:CUG92873.1 Hypothetical protein, putative [Bodo saltans]
MPQLTVDDTLRGMLEEYRGAFNAQSQERRRTRRHLVETTMESLRKFMPHHPPQQRQPSLTSPLGINLPIPPVAWDGASTPLPMPDVLAESIVNTPPAYTSKEEIMQRLAQVYQGVQPGNGAPVGLASAPAAVVAVSKPPPTSGPTGKAELMETLRKLYAS